MKKYLLILGLFCFTFAAHAQLQVANKKYEQFHYAEAIRLYEEILSKDALNAQALQNLAHSYRKINDSQNAEKWYAQVVAATDTDPLNKLYYAQALAQNGKYTEAKTWYETYAREASKDGRAAAFAKSYADMSSFYKDSARYKVELAPFNSEQADFSPMFYREHIIFCSNRKTDDIPVKYEFKWNETPFLDLYTSQGGIGVPQKVHHAINTRYHEGPVAFYNSYDSIVFTRNNYYKGRVKKSKDDVTKLKMYFANTKDGGQDWSNITEFPFNNDEYSVGHPTLSTDNSTLYFVSDMPGTLGGTDIFRSVYTNGKWSKPVNLGPEINTRGNEMFPFIDQDNNLYFASDGHPGLGGLDIFTARNKSGKYGNVQNMGVPINSNRDDFGLIMDAESGEGYFTSNREKGVGDDDIYKFRVKRCKFIAVVINGKTKEIIKDARVEIFEQETTMGFRPEPLNDSIFTFKTKLRTSYQLKAAKENFLDGNTALSEETLLTCLVRGEDVSDTIRIVLNPIDRTTQPSDIAQKNVIIDPKTGRRYTVKDPNIKIMEIANIYYDFDKYNVRPDAVRELDRLIAVMNEYPNLVIELSSHTDSRANNYYNIRLAQRRSSAAYHYLLTHGIDPKRLRVNSFGENKLTVDCPDFSDCSEEQHQLNRRTEIIVLSY